MGQVGAVYFLYFEIYGQVIIATGLKGATHGEGGGRASHGANFWCFIKKGVESDQGVIA